MGIKPFAWIDRLPPNARPVVYMIQLYGMLLPVAYLTLGWETLKFGALLWLGTMIAVSPVILSLALWEWDEARQEKRRQRVRNH